MKSIKKFNDQKVTNTHLSKTKGGDILTDQTWGGTDIRIGKKLYTNRLDGSTGNNDNVAF